MKVYTDLEQSKKLATILPIDSADMWWDWFGNPLDDVNDGEYSTEPLLHKPVSNSRNIIPCWSLAALLSAIPNVSINAFEDIKRYAMIIRKTIYGDKDNPIDACYELILKLHQEKLL